MAWSTTSNKAVRMATLVALLLTGLGHAQTPRLFESVEAHMGTLMRIQLYAPNAAAARRAFRAAFDRIAVLDAVLTDYQDGSELSRLSREAVGRPAQVSDDLYRVLDASRQISEETAGAFDITLGPLTHLWRAARKSNRVPEPAEVRAVLARCGYQKLHLNRQDRTVQLDQSGMQLDAGGIAKGFAADEALAVLERMGVPSALVAASGDLAFSGAPPGTSGWKIGLAAPVSYLVRSNGAVSTSGAAEQHLDAGAMRYSHIIDPRTGLGLTQGLTVTVTARRGMRADAASTAISVMGVERGLAWVARQADLAALVTEGDGRTHASACFKDWIAP